MIIFIYGEDTYRSFQKVKTLKEKFVREVDSIGGGIDFIDGKTATIQELSQKNNTASLFSRKRMIIIDDVFLNDNISEDLIAYLKRNKAHESDDTKNILVFRDSSIKTIEKSYKKQIVQTNSSGRSNPLKLKFSKLFNFIVENKAYVEEFKLLSNLELEQWIISEVEKLKGEINPPAIQTLIALVGNDLWTLSSEINKLVFYKKSDKDNIIKKEDVFEMVKGSFDQKIFDLLDLITSKNSRLAVKFLEEQYEAGLNEQYIWHMITNQIKTLLQIKQGVQDGQNNIEIASSVKVHPFVVKKGIIQANKFSASQLREVFSDLLKIDFKFKTGQGDTKMLLDLFILKLGSFATSR